MTKKYYFSVVILNLLPDDYGKERLAEIEAGIVSAIHGVDELFSYASEDNTAFSFPPDPSVDTPDIPVMVYIRFHNGVKDKYDAEEMITETLQRFLFKERGAVIVTIY